MSIMTDQRSVRGETGASGRKIGILGGDARQLVLIRGLSRKYECAVWGFDRIYGTAEEKNLAEAVRCADWESAVRGSDAVILPLPCSTDGETLNAPLTGKTPALAEIAEKMGRGTLLTGGMLPALFRRYAGEMGIVTADYFDSEELQIRNAVPTAEGAIAACMNTLPVTVDGMTAAVFGYGRVGRILARRLLALGAKVFAVARSVTDRAWADCDGCIPVVLAEYREHPVFADAVFNTVPHRIFDGELLSEMSPDTVIFELARDGIDMEEAKKRGIRVIPLPSLPGKTSPVTAGEIIRSAVEDILDSGCGRI